MATPAEAPPHKWRQIHFQKLPIESVIVPECIETSLNIPTVQSMGSKLQCLKVEAVKITRAAHTLLNCDYRLGCQHHDYLQLLSESHSLTTTTNVNVNIDWLMNY